MLQAVDAAVIRFVDSDRSWRRCGRRFCCCWWSLGRRCSREQTRVFETLAVRGSQVSGALVINMVTNWTNGRFPASLLRRTGGRASLRRSFPGE
jgi:hypothetical protein